MCRPARLTLATADKLPDEPTRTESCPLMTRSSPATAPKNRTETAATDSRRTATPELLDRRIATPAMSSFLASLFFCVVACLFIAGWSQLELLAAESLSIIESAAAAIAIAVCGCGGLALVLTGVMDYREERVRLNLRAAMTRLLAARRAAAAGIAQESATPDAASQPQIGPTTPGRVHASHVPSDTAAGVTWIPWPVFARLVNAQKLHSRVRGRPFTLLHLRAVEQDPTARPRTVRVEAGHDYSIKLRQLLSATMRPRDVASVSPAGDCFMLMPETVHEVGRAFAGRLAHHVQPILGERKLLEIRQFTYTGSSKSEAMRIVGKPLAA